MESFSSIDEFIKARVLPEHQEIVAALRKLMQEFRPQATEVISYGIPAWKGRRVLVVLNPTKKDITFSFANGAEFTDRWGLLRGVGKVSKHVKIKSVADINRPALRDYVKQALVLDQ